MRPTDCLRLVRAAQPLRGLGLARSLSICLSLILGLGYADRVVIPILWLGPRSRAAIKRTHKLVPDTASWQGHPAPARRYNWQSGGKSAKSDLSDRRVGVAWLLSAASRFSV